MRESKEKRGNKVSQVLMEQMEKQVIYILNTLMTEAQPLQVTMEKIQVLELEFM
nr:MAG TPA: hypothetical protein [Crassvirales sp.]